MRRAVLGVMMLAGASATAPAQFKPTDCGGADNYKDCEATFLRGDSTERQKAIIQELKKQQEELNRWHSANPRPDGAAGPKRIAVDPQKEADAAKEKLRGAAVDAAGGVLLTGQTRAAST
jgi:hypothetical protein